MKINKHEYENLGYVIANEIFQLDDFSNIQNLLRKLILKIAKFLSIEITNELDDKIIFNYLVKDIYKKNKNAGSLLYDTLNRHIYTQRLFLSDIVLDQVCFLLDADSLDCIVCSNIQFFIHLPGNKVELIGWHHDSEYYADFISQERSLVCWATLFEQDPDEGGGISLIPYSHQFGNIVHKKNEYGNHKSEEYTRNGRFYVPEEKLDLSKVVDIRYLSERSAIFMNTKLLHKSLENNSPDVRWTALARFSNIFGKSYIKKYGLW